MGRAGTVPPRSRYCVKLIKGCRSAEISEAGIVVKGDQPIDNLLYSVANFSGLHFVLDRPLGFLFI